MTSRFWLLAILALLGASSPAFAQFSETATILLADDGGQGVLNYEDGDQGRIVVKDSDANSDVGAVDQIVVTVTSPSQPGGVPVSMDETASSSGVFEATLDLSSFEPGERLTASYLDPSDDFGNVRTVVDHAWYGATLHAGTVGADTTWTKDTSPILVTGDVFVPRDFTLTIEPGTEIRFLALTDPDSQGEDSLRTELNVLGGLVAEGTAADSIVFSSEAVDPAPGDWFGLFVGDSLATVSLNHTRVEYARHGLFLESLWDTPEDTVRVTDNHFRRLDGSAIHSRYSRRHVHLSKNLIEDVAGSGIRLEIGYNEATGVLQANTIRRFGGQGVSLDRGANYSLTGNIVDSGAGVGINAYLVDTLTVRGDQIRDNEGGIYLDRVARARLTANEVDGNGAWGIQLYRSAALVDSNRVTNNATDTYAGGVFVYTDLQYPVVDSLLYNEIIGNGGEGIHNTGRAQTVAHYNNIHSNTDFDYRNDSPDWDEQNTRFNWWGVETTLEISELGFNPKNLARLHDRFDDPAMGLINYSGWLLEEYIHEDSIRVTRPGAGEVWRAGTRELIVWTVSADSTTLIDIVLTLPNGEQVLLADDLENGGGSWEWQIPEDQPGGINYEISLVDAADGRVIDASGTFTILPSSAGRMVALAEGWNLIGLPVLMDAPGSVIPTTDLLTYGGTFAAPGNLHPGRGYWLRTTRADSIQLAGHEIWSLRLGLEEGWNLIAGPNCVARIDDPNSIVEQGSLYGYSGAYGATDRLLPGHGYWIRAASTGHAQLECVDPPEARAAEAPELVTTLSAEAPAAVLAYVRNPEALHFSASEASRVLYLSETLSAAAESRVGLPPLHAEDLFDVRFRDNLYTAAWTDAPEASLSARNPTTVTWQGATSLEVAARREGEPTSITLLDPGESMTLPAGVWTLELARSDEEAVVPPTTFALHGNYPNPSASQTAIEFDLPESADVEIRVFDLLGRRVLSAVDHLAAGRHTLSVDVAALPPGLYLYALHAGSDHATGRLVVAR